MFVAEFNHCFGLSIESNDVICYWIHDDNDKEVLVQFNGIIITLPFIKIHLGNFYEVE